MKPTDRQFSRNLGFLSRQEQELLNKACVAIAGAGGDGGLLAIQLARLGVGELRLADPEPFELENINRQACCTTETVGTNKAVAVGEYIRKINPSIKITIYENGVTQNNVDDFVDSCDLVIDESEFTVPEVGVMLARAARREGIAHLMAMNVGFGATVTAFMPRSRFKFEKMLGMREDMPIELVQKQNIAISKWLPYLPPYADIDVFQKVAAGEKSAPSIAPGVAIAAAVAATQSVLLLLNRMNKRPGPVEAPRVLVMDAMTGKAKHVTLSRRSYYVSLIRMVVRSIARRNPKVVY